MAAFRGQGAQRICHFQGLSNKPKPASNPRTQERLSYDLDAGIA